ncbi:MAG: oligosaccharide flippase family protein [Bacteroidota bacterium]|nr:oligosaccharide flippase family protein [Bacteroidota bacterium]
MTLKRNIIANYFSQFYVVIIGIITLPLYLNYLGNEAYGLVGFFALMQSWMMLLDMGISPTLSREVAKFLGEKNNSRFSEFKSLLHSLEFIFIILSLIVAIVVLLISEWISIHWLKVETLDLVTVSYCITLMGIMIGIRFLSSLYRSGISGSERQVWLSIANSIIISLKFIGVIFILHFISSDVRYFFQYQLIIAILELLILSFKFYKIIEIGRFRLYFSYKAIKPILPFAMGIAYTAGIWVLLTQLDKLLLSGILPLDEYGYFAIVAMAANGILQLSGPISKAILPRMTSLYTQKKEADLIKVYKKSTQLVSVLVLSIVAIVGFYSYELLYSWTGNIEASIWGKDILFWYIMGNGILAISAFQYYLQFAYGELKMHVQYNTISVLISVPIVIWAAYSYAAIGVAIVWFVFRLISFLIWVPIVHHKFVPGIHKDWIMKDIFPVFITTIIFMLIINYVNLSFEYDRIVIFLLLIAIGLILLILNSFVATEGRKMIMKIIMKKKNDK